MEGDLETTAAAEFGKELARLLHDDFKPWLVSLGRWIRKKYRKATTPTYRSLDALLDALSHNLVKDGQRVTVECKPALVGRFLRHHFLSPMIGNNASSRLGPPIFGGPHWIFGLTAHITSHLSPVGLYPPLKEDVAQGCLYPSDAAACGFVGLFPPVQDIVKHLPALLAVRHTAYCNTPCRLTGQLRMLSAQALVDAGFNPEFHEEIRQAGEVWFFDATDDDSQCTPLRDAVAAPLWGGLYASGHIEIGTGELKVLRVVQAMRSALQRAGYKPTTCENKAGRKEIALLARGFRICIDTQCPYYSLHMDAELGLDFKGSRQRFDNVCKEALAKLQQICRDDSVELLNPLDLDFSYTDSTKAYTVMRSLGAQQIRDPMIVAIRDWHRRRSNKALAEG